MGQSWHGQVLEAQARMAPTRRGKEERPRGQRGMDGADEGWGQQRPEFRLLLGTREPQMPLLGIESMRQSRAVG